MSSPLQPRTIDDLRRLKGRQIGPTEWLELSQEAIDAFGQTTGDLQWIHVDPERAKSGPFGHTIAHGLFSLSVTPMLTAELVDFSGFAHSVNYGYNLVRFLCPVPSGSLIRMTYEVSSAEVMVSGACRLEGRHSLEIKGSDKMAMIADSVAIFFPQEHRSEA